MAPAARRDLDEIYEFIAADSATAAERVIRLLLSVIQKLADGEIKGPAVRLKDGREVRRWSVPPYRVYYRRTPRRKVMARVYHQARRSIEWDHPDFC